MFPYYTLLLAVIAAVSASPVENVGKRCTGTISSLSDVSNAQKCTTININGFTVPAGETFTISAPSGATINLNGDVYFAYKAWAGPLFQLSGTNVKFNGNGHQFNGNGGQYWDGQGTGGGVTKPAPMMKIENSGTFSNLKVVNTPSRAISVDGTAGLTISGITIDNSAGDAANSKSGGQAAGHNTDGFDVSASNVVIENSSVHNQDDCLAINKGSNIQFINNSCYGGHGVSIGSIKSDVTVSGVTISGNTITNNAQALRIKTTASSTSSTVSNVVYSNNHASVCTAFGVLIDQSYPSTLGTPGTGVVISGVNFSGGNTISVNSGAKRLEINCGSSSSCPGTMNLSGLTITGGSAGAIKNAKTSGGSY